MDPVGESELAHVAQVAHQETSSVAPKGCCHLVGIRVKMRRKKQDGNLSTFVGFGSSENDDIEQGKNGGMTKNYRE